MSRSWYTYASGQPVDQVDSYFSTTLVPTCRIGRTLCAILAPTDPNSNHPLAVSTRIQYYISDGIASGGPTPKSPLNSKKYVYFFT